MGYCFKYYLNLSLKILWDEIMKTVLGSYMFINWYHSIIIASYYIFQVNHVPAVVWRLSEHFTDSTLRPKPSVCKITGWKQKSNVICVPPSDCHWSNRKYSSKERINTSLLGSVICIMAEIKAITCWIQFHILFWFLALK